MIDATEATAAAPEPDPTLATLVPRRSLGRNLLLTLAALLLLVGAWASPLVLRPSVFSGSAGGSWAPVGRNQVVAEMQLDPQGWPYSVVTSVDDAAGATVAGAWVIGETSVSSQQPIDPAEFTSGLDYLAASFPAEDLGGAARLPHRLAPGEPAELVILWDIVDCSRLVEQEEPMIHLRSALGTATSEHLWAWAGPAADLDTLRDAGICPAP